MAAENLVVLARPHPFIVVEMKAFLTRNGYAPTPVAEMSEIARLPREHIRGVVVSTSVVSDKGSFEEVLSEVRALLPQTPMLLTTLLDKDGAIKWLTEKLTAVSRTAKLVPIERTSPADSHLGKNDFFLLIAKSDLGNSGGASIADSILKKHFR